MAQLNQSELDQLLGRSMFELVPFNVAVIDREFNIVAGNGNFEEYFGIGGIAAVTRCASEHRGHASPAL